MNGPGAPERILLIGMMGPGKTTVGRLLSEELAWVLLDSDEHVKRRTGRTAGELLTRYGAAALRRAEAESLRAAVSGPEQAVIGVAAGVVLDPSCLRLIARSGFVVWLRAHLETLAWRIETGHDDHRPWLGDDPLADLSRLYAGRETLYATVADAVIDVDSRSAAEIVTETIARTERNQ